jgi:hypothetical protein
MYLEANRHNLTERSTDRLKKYRNPLVGRWIRTGEGIGMPVTPLLVVLLGVQVAIVNVVLVHVLFPAPPSRVRCLLRLRAHVCRAAHACCSPHLLSCLRLRLREASSGETTIQNKEGRGAF